MKDIEIKNAVIESAEITMAERGILDCWLHLDFGGTCQGFGGYALYLPKSFSHHQVLSVAGHHLFRIMEIAGVEKWSQLKGRTIRVEGSWSKIERIGHIVKDDWYCPSADFKAALDSSATTTILPPAAPETPMSEIEKQLPVGSDALVVPLRSCHECRYCGPDRPEGMILCNHESWVHWDEEMRVFLPDFAPNCDSFDAKLSRHNDAGQATPPEGRTNEIDG